MHSCVVAMVINEDRSYGFIFMTGVLKFLSKLRLNLSIEVAVVVFNRHTQ